MADGQLYTTDSALLAAILRYDGNRFEVAIGPVEAGAAHQKYRHLNMRATYGGGRFWSDWHSVHAFFADEQLPSEDDIEDIALASWFEDAPVEFPSDDITIETEGSLTALIESLEQDGEDSSAARSDLQQLLAASK